MVDERSEMREEGGGKGENKGKRKWKEGEIKSIGNKKEKKDQGLILVENENEEKLKVLKEWNGRRKKK